MRKPRFAVAMVITLAAVAACGGAAKEGPAASPAKNAVETEQEPTTIDEAQAQLERARAQLQASGAGPSSAATTATPSVAPPPTAAGGETAGAQPPTNPCATACQAIASMRRAVDAICRMAGQDDARCTGAKKTLGDSETKVASCGCAGP
jgi:hypothetical protein